MLTLDMLTETSPHSFCAEHSDLRCEIGLGWPHSIPVRFGNGQPLLRGEPQYAGDGELVGMTYTQANGCIRVRIFND